MQENGVKRMKWQEVKHAVTLERVLQMNSEKVQLELPELEDGHYLLMALFHAAGSPSSRTCAATWPMPGMTAI